MRMANLGQRGNGTDGSWEQQLIGVMGENLVRQAIGIPFMECRGQHDNGVDCVVHGITLDVKTMGRDSTPQLDYVNNLIASQIKFNVDGYIFASINRSKGYEATICGWIPKDYFLLYAIRYPAGHERRRSDGSTFKLKADTYEIQNSRIRHEPTTFPDLFLSIHKYSEHIKSKQGN